MRQLHSMIALTEKERQCKYEVTFRSDRVTTVAMEKQ